MNTYKELCTAIAEGRLEDVKQFLTNESFDEDRYDGYTSLHYAARKGHLVVVKYLLQAGASINLKDYYTNTPLHYAVMHNHLLVVEYLIQSGASVDEKDGFHHTPLHYAAGKGFFLVAECLIRYGGASIHEKDNCSRTPLHLATKNNDTIPILNLLLQLGASINDKDYFGWAPLHHAAVGGHLESVKALLENGADYTIENNRGETAMYMARHAKFVLVVEFLQDWEDFCEELKEPEFD